MRSIGNDCPPLIEQRHAARGQARQPHHLERVAAALDNAAHPRDAEKLCVDDVQEIARREPIGRIENVGLAPADELFADVHGERTASQRGRQPANAETRTPGAAVEKVHTPAVVNLIVRVDAQIGAGRELQPRRRLEEDLTARQQIANQVDGIVRRILRKYCRRAVDEAALRPLLRASSVGNG